MDLELIAKEIREILDKKRSELELTFFENEHIYYMKDKDGEIRNNFPSVSKVMKLFYEEFPTNEAAEKKSKGDPILKEQLIKEWAEAGTYSTNMGSRVHYLLEKKTLDLFNHPKEVRVPHFECDFEQILKGDSMINAGTNYLKLMKDRGAVLLDTEMVLGDPNLGYTGQPDKMWLILNKDKTEFGIIITDWKTNKPKNFEENQFTKRMYPPFQKHPNNALGHYFTQLPFYGKLLKEMLKGSKYSDINIFGCIIVLLKENSEFEEFRVPKEVLDTILSMNIQKYLSY
jgi:hypothetical protein